VGKAGARGAFSPTDRAEILSHVQGQIDEVHRELTAQIKRLNALRRELDELRGNVARLSNKPR
jgi:polyhydroxyalkanoate synthesis regulator phasin